MFKVSELSIQENQNLRLALREIRKVSKLKYVLRLFVFHLKFFFEEILSSYQKFFLRMLLCFQDFHFNLFDLHIDIKLFVILKN